MEPEEIKEGYYLINNNTKTVYYYQDGEWFKAIKDQQSIYSFIQKLEKQPKIKKLTPYKT